MPIEKPSLKEKIEGRCVHFNGVQNDKCAAGIEYKTLAIPFPCFKHHASDKPLPNCEKRHYPTPEEVAAELKKGEEASSRFLKVLPVINRIKREHKGESWRGIEECPVCKGKLHLRIAACNGHVWGRCETEGCLAWME